MNCREYGMPPYAAIVVHGGPGAPGCCAGICRGLCDDLGILEHLQEGNTTQALVDELEDVFLRNRLDKAVLIGHSWGAWLSFIFAAMRPQYAGKLILVGCGPFEAEYYPRLVEARSQTVMPPEQQADIEAAHLSSCNRHYDPDHYCLLPDIRDDMLAFNEAQFTSLLDEALSMRASGELLGYSAAIQCPVVAIHGKNDPHPWDGVKKPLERRLKNFKMHLLDKCGHDPWNEYYARDAFFTLLKSEISHTE